MGEWSATVLSVPPTSPRKIVLPWTMPGMNDYIRAIQKHWSEGNQMKRRYQTMAVLSMRHQLNGPLREPVVLHYTWYEPNRKRDKDNICGFGHKVIQDALVELGALRDDGWANVSGFSDRFGVDKKHPRIEILVEEAKP